MSSAVSKAVLPSLAPESNPSKANQQFLRFQLGTSTAAMLPTSQLAEVIKIPIGKIVPLPHMPAWVTGVYNWRGEILWMLDLGHLIGLAPWYVKSTNVSNHIAIAIDLGDASTGKGNQMLGLIVNRVDDIEWLNPDGIQSPPPSAVTPGLIPFLRGYWLSNSGEMLAVLDSRAIAAAMPQS